MTKVLITMCAAFSLTPLVVATEPPAKLFEDIRALATQMGETQEGKVYEKRVSEMLSNSKRFATALQECVQNTKPPLTINFVVAIAVDGTPRYVLPSPEQLSMCVAAKINGIKLPAPPKADWLVSVSITMTEGTRPRPLIDI
jgi:hypothetical protein